MYIDTTLSYIQGVHFKVDGRFIFEMKAWREKFFKQSLFHIEGEIL